MCGMSPPIRYKANTNITCQVVVDNNSLHRVGSVFIVLGCCLKKSDPVVVAIGVFLETALHISSAAAGALFSKMEKQRGDREGQSGRGRKEDKKKW